MNTSKQSQESTGSDDGAGQNSYDEEYRFGRIPRVSAPCPFSTHQFARLLVLRSRIQTGAFAADDLAPLNEPEALRRAWRALAGARTAQLVYGSRAAVSSELR